MWIKKLRIIVCTIVVSAALWIDSPQLLSGRVLPAENLSAQIGFLTTQTSREPRCLQLAAYFGYETSPTIAPLGYQAAQNVSGGSNNIHVGNEGSAADNNLTRIGTPGTQTSFFVAGVRGITTTNNDAIPVLIDSAGQLGTVSSSRRFKEDIADMGAASRDLMRLRPVTFRYQKPFADGLKPIQYGLIAEEVAEVYPDLVAHSADGQIETVKYQVLDSMLLNEVQRQQAEIGAQRDELMQLKERLAKLEAALAAVSGEPQVSARPLN